MVAFLAFDEGAIPFPAATPDAGSAAAVQIGDGGGGVGGGGAGGGGGGVVDATPVTQTLTISKVLGPTNVVDHVVTGTSENLTAGALVTVYDGTAPIGYGFIGTAGNWSTKIVFHVDGTHNLVAKSGLGGLTSNTVGFLLDSTPNSPLYGASVNTGTTPGGIVDAMYREWLGRSPDAPGLEGWVAALAAGRTLQDVASEFLRSPEAQTHLNAKSNGDFVEQLYGVAFHRHSDAGGLKDWTDALDHGLSRTDLALSFIFSDEGQAALKADLLKGVFVPDRAASDVARLSWGLLGRAPDAEHLKTYTDAVNHGTSLHDIAQTIFGSQDFLTNGVPANADFVDSIYVQALGRRATYGEYLQWADHLQHGADLSTVAVAISESFEAQYHLAPEVESGWHLT